MPRSCTRWFLRTCGALHAAKTCNPRDFGAKGDGATKDTAAIQSAIDACAAKGGGTVRLTAGTYLSAPIVLKSNITLQLDKGATLLGSPDHADYPAKIEFRLPALQPLVSATNAENVAITGEGTIDGQGESWWQMARTVHDAGVMGNPHPRPRLIVFDHCKHVRVEGVTIQNSPFWQLVPYYSDDVRHPQHPHARAAPTRRTPTPSIPSPPPTCASIISTPTSATTTSPSNPAPSTRPAAMTQPATSPSPTAPSCTATAFPSAAKSPAARTTSSPSAFILTARTTAFASKPIATAATTSAISIFRDIDMKDVKNPLVISEYYPRILPPAGAVSAAARHAPHAPLPQHRASRMSPLPAATWLEQSSACLKRRSTISCCKNVNLSGKTGLSIGYANVTGQNVKVTAAQGDAIIKMAGANVTLK